MENNIEKLKSQLNNVLGLTEKEYALKAENKKIEISLKPKIPVNAKDELLSRLKELVPDLDIKII